MKWNDELYWRARWEHAWHLRKEGLLLKQIGYHLGIGKGPVCTLLRRTEWTPHKTNERKRREPAPHEPRA